MKHSPIHQQISKTEIVLKPGQHIEQLLHTATQYKTKDASTSLDEAHMVLMQLLDEFLTIQCSIKWSRKKARWFCKLLDVWHEGDGTAEIMAQGKAYGTTLAMAICLAILKLYGYKGVKEDVPNIPNNYHLSNVLDSPAFKRLLKVDSKSKKA